jgi:hypothetical protein
MVVEEFESCWSCSHSGLYLGRLLGLLLVEGLRHEYHALFQVVVRCEEIGAQPNTADEKLHSAQSVHDRPWLSYIL